MIKTSWYRAHGFYNNPLSIKPAVFNDDFFGNSGLYDDLIDGVESGGIYLLTGEYGSGKSTLVKNLLNYFGGQRRVIYYNCNKNEDFIDFNNLVLGAGNWFQRLFRVRKKGLYLFIDEVQDIRDSDVDSLKKLAETDIFRSVVFISKEDDLDSSQVHDLVGNRTYRTGELLPKDAVMLVRRRIGDINFIEDRTIRDIFKKNRNIRHFLQNLDKSMQYAFDQEAGMVLDEHINAVLK